MPDVPPPPAPPEQIELRRHLETILREWNVAYRHEDRFWESKNRREAVYGWGTYITRSAGRPPIRVWFDGLDNDIFVSGGRREYHEWQDLENLPAVFAALRTVLRGML